MQKGQQDASAGPFPLETVKVTEEWRSNIKPFLLFILFSSLPTWCCTCAQPRWVRCRTTWRTGSIERPSWRLGSRSRSNSLWRSRAHSRLTQKTYTLYKLRHSMVLYRHREAQMNSGERIKSKGLYWCCHPIRRNYCCPSFPNTSPMRCCKASRTEPISRESSNSSSSTPCTCTAMKTSGLYRPKSSPVVGLGDKGMIEFDILIFKIIFFLITFFELPPQIN